MEAFVGSRAAPGLNSEVVGAWRPVQLPPLHTASVPALAVTLMPAAAWVPTFAVIVYVRLTPLVASTVPCVAIEPPDQLRLTKVGPPVVLPWQNEQPVVPV